MNIIMAQAKCMSGLIGVIGMDNFDREGSIYGLFIRNEMSCIAKSTETATKAGLKDYFEGVEDEIRSILLRTFTTQQLVEDILSDIRKDLRKRA